MKVQHIVLSSALMACSAFAQDAAQPPPVNAIPDTRVTQSEPNSVHVEQAVTQGLLIHKVQPLYPKKARKHLIQGTVVLKALIGKDGLVRDLQVVSGPRELTKAALDAVKQWRYRPYLLDDEPVEVETTINVNFILEGS
jgi:protein TonB